MAVSYDLISQFAKITNDTKTEPSVTNTFGTFRKIPNDNQNYVILDGSDILTPCNTMVAAKNGDKVAVQIKNHSVTVVGSVSNPSALDSELTGVKKDVGDIQGNVGTFKSVISDKIEAGQLAAILAEFDSVLAKTGRFEELTAVNAEIDELKAKYAEMDEISVTDAEIINAKIETIHSTIVDSHLITGDDLDVINASVNQLYAYNANFDYISAQKLKAIKAEIERLDVTKLTAQQADLVYASITSLNAAVAEIESLQATKLDANTATITYATIASLNAANALIQSLQTDKLDATEAELKYVNIDFGNIDVAWIGQLFSESGVIQNVQTEQGYVSGQLFGVTINGDMINANTLKADRLVIKGDDGVYYKLNIDGLNNISTSQASKFELLQSEPEDWETNYKDYYEIKNNRYVHLTNEEIPEWNPNKYYKLSSAHEEGLDGTNIIAHTITADKITVSDLVAFGATIGGFHITNHAIYSGAKSSATNSTRGLFMNDSGEFSVGDANNFLKYYYDETNRVYKLEISAGVITMGGSGKTIEETIEEVREETTTYLHIESSEGLCFKNEGISTVLSVTVYSGSRRITNITDLRLKFGNNVHLQWKWKRINDSDYGVISSSDSRISENGFKFTLSPQDVDTKVTFICELII